MTPVIEREASIPTPATNGASGHAPRPAGDVRPLSRTELIEALMREPGKAEIIGGRIKRFELKSVDVVRKFTKAGGAVTPVAVFKRGDTADAEPAVPGFTMPVDDLFE